MRQNERSGNGHHCGKPPYFDHEIPVDLPQKETEARALELIRLVRPDWVESSIRFKTYSNGISNKIFRATHPTASAGKEKLLFRVYGAGTEQFIDRHQELENFLRLSELGLAAPIHARFRNGLITGFLEGKCVSVDELKEAKIVDKICLVMAQMHRIPPNGVDGKPLLFTIMQKFLAAVPSAGFVDDPERQKVYEDYYVSKGYDLQAEFSALKAKIEAMSGLRVVFCHNDLLIFNILYDKERDRVHFIDYEYAAFNYQLFDIANHFCIVRPCYDRCPNDEQKLHFLKTYLRHYHQGALQAVEIEAEAQEMLKNLTVFEAAAHLFWTAWALAQAHASQIDFDYLEYSILRHQQFRLKFEQLQ